MGTHDLIGRRISIRDAAHGRGCWLYRFYDDHGTLLYIGITELPLVERFTLHRRTQPWWHQVTACSVEVFADRDELLWAEWWSIIEERPRFNRQLAQPCHKALSMYGPPGKDGITPEERMWISGDARLCTAHGLA